MRRLSLSLFLMCIISGMVVSQEVGKTAPEFSHITTNNTTLNLSDYRGKVVYLFFFGWN
jgi:hypothetical protein